MARPIAHPELVKGAEPETSPRYRLIDEETYQQTLRIVETSQLNGPGGQVADYVIALRACPRTHAEPFPRAVPGLPTREQARAAAGEDLED